MGKWLRLRRNRWVLGLLVSAVLVGVWMLRRGEGPIVHGRHLSDWLDDVEMRPYGGIKLTSEAQSAVRELGEDAIPTLLKWVEAPAGTGLKLVFFRAPAFPKKVFWPVRVYDVDHGRRAMNGFRALGPRARSAFPKLVELALSSPSEITRSWAINSLTEADDAAAIPLARALQDPSFIVRLRAAGVVRCLKLSPEMLVPPLLVGEQDADLIVAVEMSKTLGMMRQRWGNERIDAVINGNSEIEKKDKRNDH